MSLVWTILAASSLAEAAVGMRGEIVRNHAEGEPIARVSVIAPGVANPTPSGTDGAFLLEFPSRQPGEHVAIEPKLAGLEVVNWPQLNAVLARDYKGSNELVIIMAPLRPHLLLT